MGLLEESEHEQWQEVGQQTREAKGEESQPSVTVECGEQSEFKSKENRRSKGQMSESQR